MRDADDCGERQRWVLHRRRLHRDAADPFAAGLDDIFGAVDDFDGPVVMDARDVSGCEPPGRGLGLVAVIARFDAGGPGVQIACGLAVMRHRRALLADASKPGSPTHSSLPPSSAPLCFFCTLL